MLAAPKVSHGCKHTALSKGIQVMLSGLDTLLCSVKPQWRA